MAKTTVKTAKATYPQIIADIRKRHFAPMYILSGPEPYFIDKIVELLQNILIAEDARDFDLTVVYGADADAAGVVNEARRFPVMSERQLVVLREAQSMRDAKNQLEKMAGYAAAPSPGSVLVIAFKGDAIKSTSALVKNAVKSGAVVFESQKPKEWQLENFVTEYCKERKVQIDRNAASLLVGSIGNDLSRLFSEVDKLIIAASGAPVTPEIIERNIGISKDFNNFELIAAISQRNYPKAMQIVDYFERNPKQNPTVVTATIIFNFFSNLLLAHYAPDRSERGLMAQLKFHSPYQLTDIGKGMPNYSAGSCTRIIHAIREFDCRSKGIGSSEDSYALLKELVFKIFTL